MKFLSYDEFLLNEKLLSPYEKLKRQEKEKLANFKLSLTRGLREPKRSQVESDLQSLKAVIQKKLDVPSIHENSLLSIALHTVAQFTEAFDTRSPRGFQPAGVLTLEKEGRIRSLGALVKRPDLLKIVLSILKKRFKKTYGKKLAEDIAEQSEFEPYSFAEDMTDSMFDDDLATKTVVRALAKGLKSGAYELILTEAGNDNRDNEEVCFWFEDPVEVRDYNDTLDDVEDRARLIMKKDPAWLEAVKAEENYPWHSRISSGVSNAADTQVPEGTLFIAITRDEDSKLANFEKYLKDMFIRGGLFKEDPERRGARTGKSLGIIEKRN